MLPEATVWINGTYFPADEARVSVFDRGFIFGESVYETFRTYDGIPWLFLEHYHRLLRSANYLRIQVPYTADELWTVCRSLADRYASGPAYIRIIVTGGVGDIVLEPKAPRVPTVIIIGKPFTPFPEEWYTRGVRIALVPIRRNPAFSLDPSVKSSNLLNNVYAYRAAVQAGGVEGLMLNYADWVAECASSNIFLVMADGTVRTPALDVGILDGVTRRLVIQLLHRYGIRVEETHIPVDDLYAAREVFMTSSLKGVVPVVQIDAHTVGSGQVGLLTHQVMQWYGEAIRAYVDRVRQEDRPVAWLVDMESDTR